MRKEIEQEVREIHPWTIVLKKEMEPLHIKQRTTEKKF